MSKELHFGEKMQKSLLAGIRKTTDAIASTLGPSGRTVLIQQEYGNPVISKDGWTVSKSVILEDALENQGAQLIKEACTKSNDTAGDGTTTTAVLANAILEEGIKSTSAGVNPISIRNGINKAVADVVAKLDSIAVKVESPTQVAQIATISANNDTQIGNEIALAIANVGNDGVITVEESKTAETYTTFVEGMSFDRGYISPYFCNNTEAMKVEFDEPYILIYDKKISSTNEILPVLEAVSRERKPLLIIAEDVEGEALTTLVVNNLRGIIQACAIKAPGFGDRRKAMLQDIAILTGGDLIDEEIGMKLQLATIDNLGMAKSVKIDSSTTTIIDGYGEPNAIEDRVNSIRREIEAATSDYDREKQQERLAKLAGGVAVIHVGAITEVELKEKKHRVEDAICSTRSAIEEGIVPGGGSTLCHIASELSDKAFDLPEEEKIGYNIVIRAIEKPIKQIAFNAGLDGTVIAHICRSEDFNIGYDAYHGKWVNMFEAGIIDPKKVVRCAVENASSVASLVLTSSCAITTIPEKECGCSSPQPGMMM